VSTTGSYVPTDTPSYARRLQPLLQIHLYDGMSYSAGVQGKALCLSPVYRERPILTQTPLQWQCPVTFKVKVTS